MRGKVLLIALALLAGSCGCAPSAAHTSADDSAASAPPRPIDKVRAGIVSVDSQFEKSAQSAQDVTNSSAGGSFRSDRGRFSKDLESLDVAVAQLRSDAVELRERATEYLALWSGQKVTVTASGAVGGYPDQRRAQVKAKYDQMVADMQQANRGASPLMADMKELEKKLAGGRDEAQSQSLRSQSNRISEETAQVRSHLDSALKTLDELTAMLNEKNG
jgi:hypothetical protein